MTRTDVLMACDFRAEQHGRAGSDETALILLQDRAQRGDLLSSKEQTIIGTLLQKLGIRSTKHVSVATSKYERESFFLTHPLGPYYTKITVPHKIIHTEEVVKEWANNPIEIAEVFDIVSQDNLLRSEGLQSCPTVSLHFQNSNLAIMMNVLVRLKLANCKLLEIRNLKLQTSQLAALKNRMAWPKLENIILKG